MQTGHSKVGQIFYGLGQDENMDISVYKKVRGRKDGQENLGE